MLQIQSSSITCFCLIINFKFKPAYLREYTSINHQIVCKFDCSKLSPINKKSVSHVLNQNNKNQRSKTYAGLLARHQSRHSSHKSFSSLLNYRRQKMPYTLQILQAALIKRRETGVKNAYFCQIDTLF